MEAAIVISVVAFLFSLIALVAAFKATDTARQAINWVDYAKDTAKSAESRSWETHHKVAAALTDLNNELADVAQASGLVKTKARAARWIKEQP